MFVNVHSICAVSSLIDLEFYITTTNEVEPASSRIACTIAFTDRGLDTEFRRRPERPSASFLIVAPGRKMEMQSNPVRFAISSTSPLFCSQLHSHNHHQQYRFPLYWKAPLQLRRERNGIPAFCAVENTFLERWRMSLKTVLCRQSQRMRHTISSSVFASLKRDLLGLNRQKRTSFPLNTLSCCEIVAKSTTWEINAPKRLHVG